jgi:hypothetical protein
MAARCHGFASRGVSRRQGNRKGVRIMPVPIPLPEQDTLVAMLRYEPETGLIYYKHGRRAFTTKTAAGYYQGRISGVLYYAHRIIWKMVEGDEPPQIDHIDGDRGNNRFSNLRRSSASENSKNMRRHGRASSCCSGVSYHMRTGRFRAYICGKHIGYFPTFEAARSARNAEKLRLGFSDRHGEPLV